MEDLTTLLSGGLSSLTSNSTNVSTTAISAISGNNVGEGGMSMMQMITNDLTLRREKVLAIMPHISGSLSMIGSACVAVQILRKAKGGNLSTIQSYQYIVLAMTFADFVSSFAYSMGTWPMPPGKAPKYGRPYRYGAIGNDNTCLAQGVGVQFGVTVILLNVLLSIHYISVIRWRKREHELRKWIMPAIAAVLLLGLVLTLPLVWLNGYGYNPVWCWISPNFADCASDGLSKSECKERAYFRRDLFYFTPLWISVGMTALIQFGIFLSIRQTEQKAKRWTFDSHVSSNSSSHNERATKKKEKQKQTARRKKKSSEKVANQSLMYIGSFLLCWVPFTIATNLNRKANNVLVENTNFWVVLMVTIFQPLQGFFNCLIYFKDPIFAKLSNCAPFVGHHCKLKCLWWGDRTQERGERIEQKESTTAIEWTKTLQTGDDGENDDNNERRSLQVRRFSGHNDFPDMEVQSVNTLDTEDSEIFQPSEMYKI